MKCAWKLNWINVLSTNQSHKRQFQWPEIVSFQSSSQQQRRLVNKLNQNQNRRGCHTSTSTYWPMYWTYWVQMPPLILYFQRCKLHGSHIYWRALIPQDLYLAAKTNFVRPMLQCEFCCRLKHSAQSQTVHGEKNKWCQVILLVRYLHSNKRHSNSCQPTRLFPFLLRNMLQIRPGTHQTYTLYRQQSYYTWTMQTQWPNHTCVSMKLTHVICVFRSHFGRIKWKSSEIICDNLFIKFNNIKSSNKL